MMSASVMSSVVMVCNNTTRFVACRQGLRVTVTTDEAILEAALQQIAITGVRRTSADDIARRAGVNRVTLYRRLGSREDILRAAYLQETARVLGIIEAGI